MIIRSCTVHRGRMNWSQKGSPISKAPVKRTQPIVPPYSANRERDQTTTYPLTVPVA